MNPYQAAIKKKKFEGLKIELTPIDKEEEKMAARMGDGAPEVYDDPAMEETPAHEAAESPDMEQAEQEFMRRANETPGIHNVTPEEAFKDDHVPPPGTRPKSLKERMLQGLKGKK